MKNCIIIVFDYPQHGNKLDDLSSISISEIKEICDFDNRWTVFNKYLSEEYKNISLCRDEEGLVYDESFQNEVYGLILIK